jgi:hypothetical protein
METRLHGTRSYTAISHAHRSTAETRPRCDESGLARAHHCRRGEVLEPGSYNIGGWHSRPDFLSRREPVVSALTVWLTWALRRMFDATAASNAFKGLGVPRSAGGRRGRDWPGDPYGEPFPVQTQAGLLVVCWLYHWVHPYAGQTPRIAVSFNATLASGAEVNGTRVDTNANNLNGETSHVDSPLSR